MPLFFDVEDKKRVRVLIDTDAACEADDPFAIAHALMSPKLDVRGLIAEHFMVIGSMQQSYDAILRITSRMGSSVPVWRGQDGVGDPEVSEGVKAIIAEARRDDPHPLFLLCIGATTNAARALIEAPDIADRLTIVTIGGRGYDGREDEPIREFNFANDPDAANTLLTSSVELWQIPYDVYTTMRVGLAELQDKVYPQGEIGKYLFEQMIQYNETPHAAWTPGESWTLGDSPAVGAVLWNMAGYSRMQPARRVNPDSSYAEEIPDRVIRVYRHMDSRFVLEDFFAKLRLCYGDKA